MKLLTKFTGLSLFLLLSFASVFASPHSSDGDKRVMSDPAKPTLVMIKLVEVVYNDSISKLLFDYEVKRMQSEFDTSISERKQRMEKFLELSKKEKLSDEDIKYVATELGFKNVDECSKYLDLAVKLIDKYEIMKLDKESQLIFSKLFYQKQIEEMKGKGSINFIKFNKNMALGGSIPPECHKCAWDYQNCMLGYIQGVIDTVIASSRMTSSSTKASGSYYITTVTLTSSGFDVQTTFPLGGACFQPYQNCLAYCRS